MLSEAFRALQARRARDASAQRAFDELIATVRAEDASLAAEEQRKKAEQQRYQAKRRGWLAALLRQARRPCHFHGLPRPPTASHEFAWPRGP